MITGGTILFLDQSLSSTGFALWDGSDIYETGAWPLSGGIDKNQRAHGFRELFGKLDATHKKWTLAQIIHETPVFGAVNKGEDQLIATAGIVAIIELFAISRGIPMGSYPPQSWRATFFTKDERKSIRGKDWKRPALLRARQLGFNPFSHDEAEAIAICDHHLHKINITPPWRQKAGAMLDPVG